MNKRQLAWQWMQQQEQCFSVSAVANAVEMDLEQCRTTINKLTKQGFVLHISGPGVAGRAKQYLVNKEAANQPRLGKGAVKGSTINRQGKTGQQLMWNALRINRCVTVGTVVAVTNCNKKSVHMYLKCLEKAGYISMKAVNTKRPNSEIAGTESQWKLKRETGPKAPLLRRGVGMYDQNNHLIYRFNTGAN